MRRLFGLCLALAWTAAGCAIRAQAVPEQALGQGPWRILLADGVRLVSGETPVAVVVAYEFVVTNSAALVDGIHLSGRWHDTPLEATYRVNDGRLTCRYAPAAGAR